MRTIGPLGAFAMGFVIAFAVAFLAIAALGLPLFAIAAFFGYGQLYLLVVAGISALVGVVFGVVAVVMYVVWRAFTRPQQFAIAIVLLAIGLALVQPEVDIVAFIGLALTMAGVSKAGALPQK